MAAHLGWADVGVGDRRDHDHRAHRPAAVDGAADPLDAATPAARPGDEGDPAALQAGPGEAAGRADEVLQGEQDQPGGLVPADSLPDPGLPRALLRPQGLRSEEHTSELQSLAYLVCRLLLEKKKPMPSG